jgi:3-oxoacyl-[acyl-carrier protein] reductase
MMERKLLHKNIIVTGTSRGMGKQMVETFANEGANVFALARKDNIEHRDYCNKVADENQVSIIPIYFELTDYEAMKEAIKKIRSYKLKIDGLVNNAGITHNALFQMTQMCDLKNVMETNFFAPYVLTQYVSKLMMRNKSGSIVNIASTAGLDGNSGKSAYGPSKAALITLTKCLAEELGGMGIRANVICPGVTDTEMISYMKDSIYNIERNAAALKKVGRVEDIAKVAVFLLSDMSSYITGQVMRVDGGITTREKGV